MFGSLWSSRGGSVLNDMRNMSDDNSELRDMFVTSSMRRYFLERITSEAKLSRDYPIPKKRWSKLRLLTTSLIESTKYPLNKNNQSRSNWRRTYRL